MDFGPPDHLLDNPEGGDDDVKATREALAEWLAHQGDNENQDLNGRFMSFVFLLFHRLIVEPLTCFSE